MGYENEDRDYKSDGCKKSNNEFVIYEFKRNLFQKFNFINRNILSELVEKCYEKPRFLREDNENNHNFNYLFEFTCKKNIYDFIISLDNLSYSEKLALLTFLPNYIIVRCRPAYYYKWVNGTIDMGAGPSDYIVTSFSEANFYDNLNWNLSIKNRLKFKLSTIEQNTEENLIQSIIDSDEIISASNFINMNEEIQLKLIKKFKESENEAKKSIGDILERFKRSRVETNNKGQDGKSNKRALLRYRLPENLKDNDEVIKTFAEHMLSRHLNKDIIKYIENPKNTINEKLSYTLFAGSIKRYLTNGDGKGLIENLNHDEAINNPNKYLKDVGNALKKNSFSKENRLSQENLLKKIDQVTKHIKMANYKLGENDQNDSQSIINLAKDIVEKEDNKFVLYYLKHPSTNNHQLLYSIFALSIKKYLEGDNGKNLIKGLNHSEALSNPDAYIRNVKDALKKQATFPRKILGRFGIGSSDNIARQNLVAMIEETMKHITIPVKIVPTNNPITYFNIQEKKPQLPETPKVEILDAPLETLEVKIIPSHEKEKSLEPIVYYDPLIDGGHPPKVEVLDAPIESKGSIEQGNPFSDQNNLSPPPPPYNHAAVVQNQCSVPVNLIEKNHLIQANQLNPPDVVGNSQSFFSVKPIQPTSLAEHIGLFPSPPKATPNESATSPSDYPVGTPIPA